MNPFEACYRWETGTTEERMRMFNWNALRIPTELMKTFSRVHFRAAFSSAASSANWDWESLVTK